MAATHTCYRCGGTGKVAHDPTLADKVGLIDANHRCGVCEGSGVSGPKPQWNTKPSDQSFAPVPDDFWDHWGV